MNYNNPTMADDSQYLSLRQSLKDSKKKNREQSKRARQLLAAVSTKLQEKENELVQVCSIS